MIESMLILLILLQVKHWYIDFVNQTAAEIESKGVYGNWTGILHSIKHGAGTFLVIWIVTGWQYPGFAFFIAIVDTVMHYHIDWIKINRGNNNVTNPKFWNHLGLDQMAHQLCYIIYAGLTVL